MQNKNTAFRRKGALVVPVHNQRAIRILAAHGREMMKRVLQKRAVDLSSRVVSLTIEDYRALNDEVRTFLCTELSLKGDEVAALAVAGQQLDGLVPDGLIKKMVNTWVFDLQMEANGLGIVGQKPKRRPCEEEIKIHTQRRHERADKRFQQDLWLPEGGEQSILTRGEIEDPTVEPWGWKGRSNSAAAPVRAKPQLLTGFSATDLLSLCGGSIVGWTDFLSRQKRARLAQVMGG